MKKNHPLLWLIPLAVLLLLIPFIVPSALTPAQAEEEALPVYSPVELANPNPDPLLPLPSSKDPNPTPYAAHEDGYVYDSATGAAWEYRDGTIYVKIEKRKISGTKVYFTWIQIADASQLRTLVTKETSPIKKAKNVNAIVAINGDWYSGRREGVIYRNGVLLRPAKPFGNYDVLLIDDEGDFHIMCRPEDNAFAPYEGSIMHSFIFGPALVVNGEMKEIKDNKYGSGPGMGLLNKTQRQAICQMGKLRYQILTTEGPNDSANGGFTAPQMAQLAYDCGAINAYNLDGGNSASLILNGVKMNRFGKGGTREITDMIYFITAEPASAPAAEPEAPAP